MKRLEVVLSVLMIIALLIPSLVLAAAPANPLSERGASSTVQPDNTVDPAVEGGGEALPEEDDGDGLDDEGNPRLLEWELEFDELEDVILEGVGGDPLEMIGDYKNILLIGIDARPKQKTGRSDTMIVVTMDGQNNQIKLTSIMRDTYVEIPGKGSNRINAAYVYGGADLLLQTIEHNFGIKIDYYITVNFSMLAEIIDQIGGLTIDIKTKAYMDAVNGVIKEDNVVLGVNTNDGLLTQTGEQNLTGKQAQAYARFRRTDNDFFRTQRQREVITKCIDKLKGLSIPELLTLVDKNLDNLDTNLTVGDIINLMPAALLMSENEIAEMRIPIDGGYSGRMVKGMSVLVPDLSKNRQAYEEFITGNN